MLTKGACDITAGMKNIWLPLLAVFLVLQLLAPSGILAHPHVWVDKGITAVFDDQGLRGFAVQWTFDEMFSEQIRDLAEGQGTVFSDQQISRIKEEYFDNLRLYNYFTRIWIDGREFQVQFVRDFSARMENRRVVYEFFLPCTVSALATPKVIRLMIRDPDFFVDFAWDKTKPVRFDHPASLKLEHEFQEDKSLGFFDELFSPRVLHFQFRKDA